jgi:triacylglycerol esterase/lipase EstA (alpha/beta hydrolase family)
MIRHLDEQFGAPSRNLATWNPVVIIRHGFVSNHKPFKPLKAFIKTACPNAIVNNRSYAWKDSALVNGIRLASDIVQEPLYQDRDIVLIGHSLGGLVCRVANVAMRDPDAALTWSAATLRAFGYAASEVQAVINLAKGPGWLRSVAGIVTLATPNSGALLQGQVSNIAALVQQAANIFAPTRVSCVADLTTSRLFELLQHAHSDTKMLSISGSRWNRFATASGQVTRWTGLGGIKLDMPHDYVVEDQSVDLARSILPNEVVHRGSAPYLHMRAYTDCTSVTHTSIYDHQFVREAIVEFLRRC